jgi:hypothetical protein
MQASSSVFSQMTSALYPVEFARCVERFPSPRPTRCQIGSAICACLLVAIVKRQLDTRKTLPEILQIVGVNIFEQTPMAELLATSGEASSRKTTQSQSQNLLILNN